MRILILGPAHPYRGGIADTNESLCDAFLKLGHEASIITFTVQYPNWLFPGKTQYSESPSPAGLKIERWIHSMNPLNWRKVANKIKQIKPDLIIVRYWIPVLGPALGNISRRVKGTTKRIAMCDNVIPHEKRFGDQGFTKYFMNSFDGFITLSKTTFKELDEYSDKIKTHSPHPINTNLGPHYAKSEARKHLGLDPERKYLLFFGLIREYKGLDLTIGAFGKALKNDPELRLLVVGEFYEDKEKYLEMIRELGIADQVIIKDEFIATEEVGYYFSAADLIIQTYKTASQSGVSQTAFYFDRPILVTNVGGLAEVIHHGKLGYVCEKDESDIANNIIDFFGANRFEEFSMNVAKEKEKYSWTIFAEKIIGLSKKITS